MPNRLLHVYMHIHTTNYYILLFYNYILYVLTYVHGQDNHDSWTVALLVINLGAICSFACDFWWIMLWSNHMI